MIDYDTWNKYARENNAVEPSPVTIISLGRSEVDHVLDGLGVIRRGCGVVENTSGVDSCLPSGNTRRVPGVGAKVQKQKPKMNLQPKDLKIADLQELTAGDIKYQEIMELYGFTNVRYFKEVLKSLGYRLLRGELWVVEDKLWLEAQQ